MTEDAVELQIQDYLDDRMSAGERRAFEERLTADGDLARRVRDLRAVSQALRQDSPDLPPGFYTRLRSRFEAQHVPVRRWFRLLSWETAGLVAAVVLAGVLFVPFVLERQPGRPESQILFEPPQEKLQKNEMSDEVGGDLVEDGRLEETQVEGLEYEEPPPINLEDSDWAPSPEEMPERQRRDEPAKSRSPPPAVATPKKADKAVPLQAAPAAEPDRAKQKREGEKGASSAPADVESRTQSGREAVGEAKDEVRAQSEAFGYRSAGHEGVVLPGGVVDPGEVVEIRSQDQWNRLMRSVGRETLGGVGDYDPTVRLVLVGPREVPIDCARTSVGVVADAHEIRLVALAGASAEPVHGCAFRLPLDDRPVRVLGPADNR